MLLQILSLVALSEIGHLTARLLELCVSGNMLDMLWLSVLLLAGVVTLRWIEQGAGWLVWHLAFFIPLAVGLMSFGHLFARGGLGVMVALVTSTTSPSPRHLSRR